MRPYLRYDCLTAMIETPGCAAGLLISTAQGRIQGPNILFADRKQTNHLTNHATVSSPGAGRRAAGGARRCANSESMFETAPNAAACGGETGGTGGHGVRNATVEDITVEAFTVRAAEGRLSALRIFL